jgi:hypothetical protein
MLLGIGEHFSFEHVSVYFPVSAMRKPRTCSHLQPYLSARPSPVPCYSLVLNRSANSSVFAAEFYGSSTITKAGGGFGVVTAFIAYYCAMAELLRPNDSWFTLPLGQINNVNKRVD